MLTNNSNKLFRLDDLSKMQLNNLGVDGKYIVVIDKSKEGVLESSEYDTLDFKECVGSWCALKPDEKSFVNLEISIRVDGSWSKYFTYGDWRLYGENLYYDQDRF